MPRRPRSRSPTPAPIRCSAATCAASSTPGPGRAHRAGVRRARPARVEPAHSATAAASTDPDRRPEHVVRSTSSRGCSSPVPPFRSSTSGSSIVATTSIRASTVDRLMDYAMTKAALVAFTKALAEELGPRGIRVNAVAPGPIWTPSSRRPAGRPPADSGATPLGRAGQPAELAGAYVYLASDDAWYVSGRAAVTGRRGL